MDQRIESYIRQIVDGISCSPEDKKAMADEMRDHLTLLKNEYIDQGLSDEEAARKALDSFGDREILAQEYRSTFSPAYRVMRQGKWVMFGAYATIVLSELLFMRMLGNLIDFLNGNPIGRYISQVDGLGFWQTVKMNANVVPFRSIGEYIWNAQHYNLDIILHNLLGNILIFLPLGVFLPVLFEKLRSSSKVLAASLAASFLIELLQLGFKAGRFDVDDILLNVLGSMVGLLIFKAAHRFIRMPKKLAAKKV